MKCEFLDSLDYDGLSRLLFTVRMRTQFGINPDSEYIKNTVADVEMGMIETMYIRCASDLFNMKLKKEQKE